MGYACHTHYSGWCEQAVKKVILWGKIRFFNRNVGFLEFCRKKKYWRKYYKYCIFVYINETTKTVWFSLVIIQGTTLTVVCYGLIIKGDKGD